jgi:DNA end-binding protein Ku
MQRPGMRCLRSTSSSYEIGKRDYIKLDPKELEAIALHSRHTIEIDEFVPKQDIDELYMADSYYLAPDG